ncbi:putative Radical SAM domain protein [Candidatus Zixiibacteriota bacterium]|nr:putative Radical SAM domain protein [candidate division Zixibacteria bacterium]
MSAPTEDNSDLKITEYKASRYNQLFQRDKGNWLAFNALTCGLAEMNSDNHRLFAMFLEKTGLGEFDIEKDFILQLQAGGFIVPREMDEIEAIRAGHYQARFGRKDFCLTIIPTLACNFSCDYCYEPRSVPVRDVQSPFIMPEEVCNNIGALCEKRIAENTHFHVTWYGGEPLLAMDTIEKLTNKFKSMCSSKGSSYFASVITNGYLLTKECLNILISSGVVFIQITVDGPEQIHNERRHLKSGAPTYQTILQNLENIEDDSPLLVAVRINIDKRNSEDIYLLLEELRTRGLNHCRNIVIYLGQVIHNLESCSNVAFECMAANEFASFSAEIYKEMIKLGFKIPIYPHVMMGSCAAVGTGGAVIEPDGTIHNCWNAVGNKSMSVGQLTRNGIEYNPNSVKWLGWNAFRDECLNCNILPICMGGCPYRTIKRDAISDAMNNTCSIWKYNMKSLLEIARMAREKGLLIVPWEKIKKR